MNLTDDEMKALKNTKSSVEWNAQCDKIKRARNGEYPPDWWAKIQLSGFMHSVAANWK